MSSLTSLYEVVFLGKHFAPERAITVCTKTENRKSFETVFKENPRKSTFEDLVTFYFQVVPLFEGEDVKLALLDFLKMALNLTVKVHPVVKFQIVDAYERRNADAHRVIGTLLGFVDKGVVEVTNCFCVPHKEYEVEVEAELSYASDMYELNRKVNPQEAIVGWWATGHEVTCHSSVIHEYYARECNNPIHMTLDTTLQGDRMGLRAYLCVPIGVPGGKAGSMFTPIPVEVICYEPEIVGINLCWKTVGTKEATVEPMQDLAQVADAAHKLTGLLDQVLAYVEDIVAGRIQGNPAVGRALLDMVYSVPKMTPQEFDSMFTSNIRDLLMVITLTQLTKTQLQLNEKLTMLTTL